MPRRWSDIERDREAYPDEDFKTAAYRLVTRQVLYRSDRGNKTPYDLICRHEKEFRDAMALLGLSLHVDVLNSYVAVVPEAQLEVDNPQDLITTLLLLVARRLYHEQKDSGELQAGVAAVAAPDFAQTFLDLTGREIDAREGPLREVLHPLKQSGVIRLEKISDGLAESQPYQLEILPAIELLAGENATEQLAAHLAARVATKRAHSSQSAPALVPEVSSNAHP